MPDGLVRRSSWNRLRGDVVGVMGILSRPGRPGRHRPGGEPDLKRRPARTIAPPIERAELPNPHRGRVMMRLAVVLVVLTVSLAPARADDYTAVGKHGM